MLAYEHQADGVQRLVEHPTPTPEPGGITVDVVAAGICGTDLKIARGEHRMFPRGTTRVPGHESVGVIRENASGNPRFAPGTRVAIAPNISCGTCRACQTGRANLCENYDAVGLTFNGGFAETIAIPASGVTGGNVMAIPDGLDLLTASLVEPVAAVVRGLRPLSLTSCDTILICGAGPIGLIALLVAKHAGVRQILVSQTSPARRELATSFGADATFDPRAADLAEQIKEHTDGWGADAIVAAAPIAQVFSDSLRCAAKGGRINFFAGLPSGAGVVPLDANLIHYNELLVTGSTANTNEDCREALELVASAPELFRPLITHTLPLEQADEAFALAASGKALKVILEP
ncbi:alcohol dehydrogenase catalytic domain-containing protein [Actinomycetaceae bacterium L2_0104]